MSVEIIADKDDFFGLRILVLDKVSHKYRPIGFCSPRRNRYRLSAVDRLYSEKDVRCSVSFVFAIILQRLSGLNRNGDTNFPNELLAQFVHADLRIVRIIRSGVDFQDILHGTDKFGVLFRGNAPFFFLPGLQFIFFNALRTASPEREST